MHIVILIVNTVNQTFQLRGWFSFFFDSFRLYKTENRQIHSNSLCKTMKLFFTIFLLLL